MNIELEIMKILADANIKESTACDFIEYLHDCGVIADTIKVLNNDDELSVANVMYWYNSHLEDNKYEH